MHEDSLSPKILIIFGRIGHVGHIFLKFYIALVCLGDLEVRGL